MPKLYYDITHLLNWKGGLTGIPRTTDEIGRRLKDIENVEFVTWDKAAQGFLPVDKQHYYNVIDPSNRGHSKQASPKEVETSQFMRAKHIVATMPVVGKAARKLKHAHKRLRNAPAHHLTIGKIEAKSGDMLFIPCGVWDDDAYIETTLRYKRNGAHLAFISYDMLPIVVPQFSGQWGKPMADFTEKVTSVCDVVFSISESTKYDLETWLNQHKLPIPRIDIIRLGDAYNLNQHAEIPDQKEFVDAKIDPKKNPFILCVGTIEARKNHTLLYYTYKLAKSRGVQLPKLIISGRPGHRTENIIDIIRDDPDVNNDILLLMNVSDRQLSWLYSNCMFTVYSSFYEGWGLPIAESIANGVPCICSNTSSMVEVAPDFVRYFNPTSSEECLSAIQYYLKPAHLTEARNKAKKYVPVTWDTTYDQVVHSLKDVMKGLDA